ncbi:MAG: HlyD family efflux transporter periplasmic adaptor subunit [Planctomycetales bacterium]
MKPRTARNQRHRSGAVWVGLAVVALLTCAAVGGGLFWFSRQSPDAASRKDSITSPVIFGRFQHVVTEQGEIESATNVDIRCEIKGKASNAATTITWIIPEGTHVQPGDRLIEFKSTDVRDLELQQRIVFEQASAALTQATLAHQVAVIAFKEYENGLFIQQLQMVENEIVVAEENLRRAEDYAKYSERMFSKGYVTQSQLEADRFAEKSAQLAVAASEMKKTVLEKYTREKTLNQLQSDRGAAEAQQKAHQASVLLEEEKLKEFQTQLEKCKVVAPSAGQVVYANVPSRRGSTETVIEVGSPVKEQQIIIRLPDPSAMQVKVKIKESRISLIKVGQPASVTVDAMPGVEVRGEVTSIDPIALMSYYSNVKEYVAYVKLQSGPDQLKPGMTAKASIVVEEHAEALQAPIQAVREIQGDHYVVVQSSVGAAVRHVQLGPKNSKFVVVTAGLKEDQDVVLNPGAVLREHFPEADLAPSQKVAASKGKQSPQGKRKKNKPGQPNQPNNKPKTQVEAGKRTQDSNPSGQVTQSKRSRPATGAGGQ